MKIARDIMESDVMKPHVETEMSLRPGAADDADLLA